MNDKEMQQIIKNLEEKVKRLEKSNRNWRRKCQRLRNEKNKVQWFSEMIKPEEHKRVVVRDENGNEYWSARELQNVLQYKEWRKFEGVINKAKKACENKEKNACITAVCRLRQVVKKSK